MLIQERTIMEIITPMKMSEKRRMKFVCKTLGFPRRSSLKICQVHVYTRQFLTKKKCLVNFPKNKIANETNVFYTFYIFWNI